MISPVVNIYSELRCFLQVEHHLSSIERYLDLYTTERSREEPEGTIEQENITGSVSTNFSLFPMSETLQARMIAEFLSSFGKHPHVQNDSIKKALQNDMYRVLEIGARTLAHHAILDPHIVACLVKVRTYFRCCFNRRSPTSSFIFSLWRIRYIHIPLLLRNLWPIGEI